LTTPDEQQGPRPDGIEVEFFTITPDIKVESASTSMLGSLPSRAVQLCPPVSTATGNGWYVYPPIDFALRWLGHESEFSLLENNEPVKWQSLAGFHDIRLPQSAMIADAVPEEFKANFDIAFAKWGGEIPFCDADPRAPNLIELLTGVYAKTPPGWSLLVRGVANWTGGIDHQAVEGIVDTSWYSAMLPTMVRLLRQDQVVRFYRRFPYAMFQLVPTAAFTRSTLEKARVHSGVEHLPAGVWRSMVEQRNAKNKQPGRYAREQRKRNRDANARRGAEHQHG
jgi:hypothetical protein